MNDHIRVSDADRERVAGQLRDQYAEGRLTADELDDRITATLSAKTVAELRRVTADLPVPEPAAGAAGPGGPGQAAPRRGPGGRGAGAGSPCAVTGGRGSCRCSCCS